MKARKSNPIIKLINSQINEYKGQANEYSKKADALKQSRMLLRVLYGPIVDGFDMNNGSLSMSWIGNKPYITAYLYKLDSLKDERLTSLISKCMDVINSMEVEERDVADWGYKRYTIENPDVNFEIVAYVKEDSPTCKKVVVKREMKEVLTTKYVCEE
jgi:hypothetical protein